MLSRLLSHGNKPMNGAGSPSCRAWISTIKLAEKYKTAN